MDGYQFDDFRETSLSVAFTGDTDSKLRTHLDKGPYQEDLTFAYWRPSRGARRFSALLHSISLPKEEEHILHGNVEFTAAYLSRVLEECPQGSGIALLHSHLGPGWQDMSHDDVVAEQDRLAGVVAGRTHLPLVGLTLGTDGTWSGRFWFRVARHLYQRRWAETVRVVGKRLRISNHPTLRPPPKERPSQVATVSVWGSEAQRNLVRTRVGIVGLGSVGSMLAEALSRTGIEDITLIDFDHIEERNLDRTLGAFAEDIGKAKVQVSKSLVERSHTSDDFQARAVVASVAELAGLSAALDCDVVFSCVDRPWPRHILNVLAYAHLIPVIDGGILARVNDLGQPIHIDWRIHTVGPGRACLYCLNALRRGDPALDRDGKLDDPDYIAGLSPEDREQYERRNVFAFSLSVAAHEVLQLVGLITGMERVGGTGPQTYHAYPGIMEISPITACQDECDIAPIIASASTVDEGRSPRVHD